MESMTSFISGDEFFKRQGARKHGEMEVPHSLEPLTRSYCSLAVRMIKIHKLETHHNGNMVMEMS